MNAHPLSALAAAGLSLAIPITFALCAVLRPRAGQRAALVGLASALGLGAILAGAPVLGLDTPRWLRLDGITVIMLSLVCGIGTIIARYGSTYLRGDPHRDRLCRYVLLTLSAVSVLVIAGNLLVMAVAWTATSLALNPLLTLYGKRTAAVATAHKKFLVTRLADLCFWSAIAMVWHHTGSVDLDGLDGWIAGHAELPAVMQAAAVLVVIAVVLRSAQLPFHGWLIQVMEAPTPVSALLHAGVVNIGGFVLIRLSPWLDRAPLAMGTLLLFGLTTTVLAALVLTTRISVKVGLAWSTCAQMGFMLVQCALGAWHLALLHLVAHSLYKAHAFLSSGSVVARWQVGTLSGNRPAPQPTSPLTLAGLWLGVPAVVAVALVCLDGSALQLGLSGGVWVLLLAFAVAPMVAPGVGSGVGTWTLRAASALGLALCYGLGHIVASALLPDLAAGSAAVPAGWAIMALGLMVMFGAKTALIRFPDGALARRLHPWLFAGFYLDEHFTRLTFRIWPPRPVQAKPETAAHTPALQEA